MKDKCYITFNRYGVSGMKKRYPELKAGEYAVKINLSVPERFFDREMSTVNIDVPEDHIIVPEPVVEMEPLDQ